MKYVLDASVAMRWVIRHPLTLVAMRLRAEYLNKIHELLAPDIFVSETTNALTKAERQKLITVGESLSLHSQIASTLPTLHPHFPLIHRALEISSQTRSGFYDCLYVALAENQHCELVTADDKLLRNLQAQFRFIISLASVP